MQQTGAVAVCFFGDGALEQGILHETTNLAAIWKLPVVYVCENNQYAMSARSDWSVAGGDPAARAAGYGIPGVNVDGMDLLAVFGAASELIERARRGDGPSYLVAAPIATTATTPAIRSTTAKKKRSSAGGSRTPSSA